MKVKNGEKDSKLESQFKKQRNYCNKLIKKAVREKEGKNISNSSSAKQIWNCINAGPSELGWQVWQLPHQYLKELLRPATPIFQARLRICYSLPHQYFRLSDSPVNR